MRPTPHPVETPNYYNNSELSSYQVVEFAPGPTIIDDDDDEQRLSQECCSVGRKEEAISPISSVETSSKHPRNSGFSREPLLADYLRYCTTGTTITLALSSRAHTEEGLNREGSQSFAPTMTSFAPRAQRPAPQIQVVDRLEECLPQ